MACFTAPLVESVIVTAVTKVEEKKELKNAGEKEVVSSKVTIPLSRRLKWLSNMLYGGSALLAFEHVWHGEITPWFPFLTAMQNAEDAAEMFHEIATVGVTMAALITVTWVGICAAATSIVNRRETEGTKEAV